MSYRYPVPLAKVPARGSRVLLNFDNKSLALFNVADVFYAIDDSCPHQGASLCGGRLDGRVIQCCAHGLRFDLASGYLLNSTQLKVASYPVEWQGEQLFIVIESEESGQ
ncbi:MULTISPECIES: Rieske (2Fe-2S) protein [Pseudomonas]|jgi:nitrite reductase/ring-hydroxylating ferredoxin subunit|uniref:Rieske (2Fe-2S) domain-containing protein n=1 Tax=Pseudomonas alkylphenolica TaxID=237609 RepID=A0A077F8K5_9PSED|nr:MULTISPECIES: Rieske 2Fe-2S domain-containing protein [Pseudomonas]AIL61812.1 Rieske (2Fe-2S) domain-containing protein [Pseudomonas alkylphenolica]QGW77659.1 Rieske 2Fe-2S domain-containing protein [Pseudomonas alkylphenolica]